MEEPIFLGIDIGTQDIRGILVTLSGEILAQRQRALSIISPESGLAEHNALRDWWGNTCAIIQQLLVESGISARRITGVGVAGLFPVTCALDQEGQPVANAILYSDSRSESEVKVVSQICGQTLVGDEVTPNLVWLARNRPNDFVRIGTVLSSTGYIVHQLTGRKVIDPHNAYRFGGVIDETGLDWKFDTLKKLGLPREIFPQVTPPSVVAGGITSQAGKSTGLMVGTPVITGTTDTIATLIGHGVLDAGDAMIYYGTTGLLTLITIPLEEAIFQPSSYGPDIPYCLAVYLLGSGAALRWAMDILTGGEASAQDEGDLYRYLDASADEVIPGSEGLFFLPYMSGRLYPQPDGLARGHLSGLDLKHQARHLWRAYLEGPGYVLATRLKQPLPHPIQRLFASGGGARSEIWRKIISDMVGLTQVYSPRGSGALGVAYLTALALGHFDTINAIQTEWLGEASITRPDPSKTAIYQELLPKWQALDRLISTLG